MKFAYIFVILLLCFSFISARNIETNGVQWDFNKIPDSKQEVDASVSYLSGNELLEITLNNHANSTTGGGYKWDAVLCTAYNGGITYYQEDAQGGFGNSVPLPLNYVKLSDYGITNDWCYNGHGYILFSAGSKNQFPLDFRINVSELTGFKVYAGTESLEVNGILFNYTENPPSYFSDWYFGDNAAYYDEIVMIPMKNLTETFTSDEFIWNATNESGGSFWINTGAAINLTEFHWNVSSLETKKVCTRTNMYGGSCTYEKLDFNTFLTKNNITNYTQTDYGNYTIVSFYGEITDLDPSFTVSSYSTGDGWYNTTSTSLGHGVSGDAPLLSMQFDEDSGTTYVKDDSIFNNYGTEAGSINYNSSCNSEQGGGCYEFDGNGDWIEIGDTSTFDWMHGADDTSGFQVSVSFWMRTASADPDAVYGLISTGTGSSAQIGYDIVYDDRVSSNRDGIINLLIAKGSNGNPVIDVLSPNESIPDDGNWHHIVITYDQSLADTNANFYVDGVSVGTGNKTANAPSSSASTHNLHIGSLGAESIPFNGSIDNVQIWDRVLSVEEIVALNNTPTNFGKYMSNGNYTYFTYWNESAVSWISNYSIADSDGENITDIASANLVSYWPLDNSPLDSVGGNDGTINGDIVNSTGLSSDAYEFDGDGDYVVKSSPTNLDITTFTLSAWINPNEIDATANVIIMKDDNGAGDRNFYMSVISGGLANGFQTNGGAWNCYNDTPADNGIDANVWNYVTVTYDGSNMKSYVNGIEVENRSCGQTPGTDGDLYIGIKDDGALDFNGSIDEVAIWNTSLTAAQITDLYKTGLSQHANANITLETRTATSYNTSDASLVAFLNCNEDNSTHCNDETGVHNGTFGDNVVQGDDYGVLGQGLDYDGTDDYMSIANHGDFDMCSPGNETKLFTYSTWINFDTVPSNPTAVALFSLHSAGEPAVMRYLNGQFVLWIYDGAWRTPITADYTPNANQWYHVAYVKETSEDWAIYINGIDYATGTNTYNCSALTTFFVGSYDNTASQELDGSIDEIRIYNRSLTAAEINNLYEMGSYHVSDWGSWDDEGTITDGTSDTSTSTGNFFQQRMKFNTNDTDVSPFLLAHNVTQLEDTTPTIVLDDSYALDSDGATITGFNSSNLEEIENMVLNFSVTTTGTIDTWYLNFTANGTNGCALGNKQSAYCYNWTTTPEWIKFLEGNETDTYNDTGGAQGDKITVARSGGGSDDDIDFTIDEHYNPNIAKHYEALYNFSNVSWQDGADQRINQDNQILVVMGEHFIPLDADQYKLDFRVQNTSGVNTPTQPLEAWICNSTYITGNVQVNPNCVLVTEKLPSELQDDGTKFRGIFTKNLINGINEIEYVVLRTDENNPNKYYSIKTFGILNATHTQEWNYSTDEGSTWLKATDGYESEMNINWFYNGATPTEFIYNLWVNTTNGDEANLTGNITWTIDATNNYPPLVNIITPVNNASTNETININWSISEPNNDGTITNVTLSNGTDFVLVTNAFNDTATYSFDPSSYADGQYNLTVHSCENATSDLYCGNDTHILHIDNPDSPAGALVNDKAWTRDWDGTVSTITISENNSNDADVTYKIYQDGVDKGVSDTEKEIGSYTYVLNTTGGANWTNNSNMDTQTLVINSLTNYPSLVSIDTGTLNSGTLGSLQADDADNYVVDEAAATPGLLLYMNFSDYDNYDTLQYEYSYDGTHTITVEALNDSAVWDELTTISTNASYVAGELDITQANYDADSVFQLRFSLTGAGDAGHSLGFDYVRMYSEGQAVENLQGVARVTPSEIVHGIPHISFKQGDQVFR